MQSIRVSSTKRLLSPAFSLRLGSGAATLPAGLSCRAQRSLSTSLLQRALPAFQTKMLLYKSYSNGSYRNNSSGQLQTVYSPSSSIYFGNLPWEATSEDIQLALADFKGVMKVSIGMYPDGRSRGFAHIDFENVEQATLVVEAHKESPFMFGERQLNVSYGQRSNVRKPGEAPPTRGFKKPLEPSTCLFIGGIPYEATEQDVKEAIAKFAKPISIRLSRDKDGYSKGFAHMDFSTIAEAENVYETYLANPIQILSRDIFVDRATPTVTKYPASPRLHFKNFHGTESELLSIMGSQAENVLDIHFLSDRDSNTTFGAGFILFKDQETATEVLNNVNGKELEKGALELQYAKPRAPTRQQDNSYGRSGRRTSYGTEWGGKNFSS